MTTTAVIVTTKENKRRRAEQHPAVDEAKEEAAELTIWTDRLARWLAKNRTCNLGSVVDLSTLFPDWTIGDVQIGMLAAEVILRVVMAIFKDYGPPMSFSVYKSLRADYATISHYALALNGVIPSDIINPTAGSEPAKKEKVDEKDERYDRVVLLRNIARDLVPGMINDGEELHLHGEHLRSVDRAFLAWPVRYATPSCIFYHPEDDEEDLPANINFYWAAPCDVFGHHENNIFDIDGDVDEFELIAQDEKDQALLERVDKRGA